MWLALGTLLLAQSVLSDVAPSMVWTDCPDDSALCLRVDFASESDVALLNPKYEGNDCIFEGSFANAPNVRVFVSSEDCPINEDSDDIQVSFADPRCPSMYFFDVDPTDGFSTSELAGQDGEIWDEAPYPPEDISHSSAYRSELTERPNYPAGGFNLNLIIFYDNDFATEFGADSETRIQAIVGHAQTIYYFNSLDAPMTLNIEAIETYDNVTEATGDQLDYIRDYVIPNEPRSPNLFAYFTYKNNAPGTVGIAWVGVVCLSDGNKGYRVGINEYFNGDLNSAEIFAHEVGHNLNMEHDFDPNPGNDRLCGYDDSVCTNLGGVMDYFQPTVDKWTCCSNHDFGTYYDERKDNFCLTNNPNGPTTPAPTTVAPTTAGPTTAGPTTAGPTTKPPKPCKDKKKSKKCKKLMKKGKCNKKKVWKKCKKTCNKCN